MSGENFLDVEKKDIIFGNGLKGLTWSDDETKDFIRIINNEHEVRKMISASKSNLTDKKEKAWFFVYKKLKDNHPRLKELNKKQLVNKMKTIHKQGNANMDRAYKASCSQTGGGRGMPRPTSPSGEDIMNSSVPGYTAQWAGTAPQRQFMYEDSTQSEQEDVERGLSLTPPPMLHSPATETVLAEFIIEPSAALGPSSHTPGPSSATPVASSVSTSQSSSATTNTRDDMTPLRKKRKVQDKKKSEDVAAPKEKLSIEEDNFFRNRRQEVLKEDQLKTNHYTRLRHFYEVKKICEECNFDWPEAENKFKGCILLDMYLLALICFSILIN